MPEGATESALEALPPELDPITPMVDRDHEMHWLRGTWRQSRRGKGRLVFVSGPAGIGKTRLIAELAGWVHERSGRVRYAGAGGAGTALAIAAVREVAEATDPRNTSFRPGPGRELAPAPLVSEGIDDGDLGR